MTVLVPGATGNVGKHVAEADIADVIVRGLT